MTSRHRRLLGLLLVLLAIGGIAAIAISGVPPVRMSSTYFQDTGETKHSTKVHWAVVPSVLSLLVGLVLMVIPRGKQIEPGR